MRLGKYEELNEQQQEIIYKKYGCLIDCAIDREIDGLKQQMAIEFDSNFSIKIEQKSINIHDDGIYGINIFYVPFDDKTSLTIKTIEPLMEKFLQLREYDNRLAKFDNRTIKVFLSLFNNDDIEFDIDNSLDTVNYYCWCNLDRYPRLQHNLNRLVKSLKKYFKDLLCSTITEIKGAADYYFNNSEFVPTVFSDMFFDLDTLDLVKHIKSNPKDVTEINNILSVLSLKIDKLKQDFSLNNAFNKQDITEIKILLNTIEGVE